MPSRLSLNDIRRFWTEQANRFCQLPAASWTDTQMIDLEIREITRYLQDGDSVLDVGCANGYSTVQYAAARAIEIKGIDFINPMIDHARDRLANLSFPVKGSLHFSVGDITAMQEPDNHYDKVIVVRVLINLSDWSFQRKAIEECARVLKPGGMLILSEAVLQGWNSLNRFRMEWGLPAIPMPSFNNYLDEDKVKKDSPESLRLDKVVDFASTYYVGTRLLKPLLIKALGIPLDAAAADLEWNRFLAQLPSWGDYGTQKQFIFTKR